MNIKYVVCSIGNKNIKVFNNIVDARKSAMQMAKVFDTRFVIREVNDVWDLTYSK